MTEKEKIMNSKEIFKKGLLHEGDLKISIKITTNSE